MSKVTPLGPVFCWFQHWRHLGANRTEVWVVVRRSLALGTLRDPASEWRCSFRLPLLASLNDVLARALPTGRGGRTARAVAFTVASPCWVTWTSWAAMTGSDARRSSWLGYFMHQYQSVYVFVSEVQTQASLRTAISLGARICHTC